MALAVIAIPVLALAVVVYWLRQSLIYDVLFLVTKRYAIWRTMLTITPNDIDDLVGIRVGFSHYWVTCSGSQELDVSVHVTMPPVTNRGAAHARGVWPEALYRIDRLVFDRNRKGTKKDRATGRELDLGDTVTLLLDRHLLPKKTT